MENLILLAHVVIALIIIGLILLQQGKGADMGASFGSGASQTLFGASGSGNFFSKMTAIFAFVFFVTSFSLAVIAKQSAGIGDEDIPAVEEKQPLDDSLPEVDDVVDSASDDLPVADDVVENSADDLPITDDAEVPADDIPES